MFKSVLTTILFLLASTVSAQENGIQFFEKNIRPVLNTQCYSCHSSNSKDVKGGLSLDTRQGILNGGDSGPSVVPGKIDESLLLDHIESGDMPPDNPLSQEVVDNFKKWVKMGMPDPRYKHENRAIELRQSRQFWSFKKVQRPSVAKYNGDVIDGIINDELQKQSLTPIGNADEYTLIRRLYYDLIGLPPSVEQLNEYINSSEENKYERLVDSLLEDRGYGEKWARHWLDIARYGESTGQDRNLVSPYAWRYRDYVIDSFNNDKPYDQFIKEQVAGDLLPHKNYQQYNDQITATGFLTVGTKNLGANTKQYMADTADDQIDAITRGFLGMTLSCARCHDHKFDPFSQEDYYGVAGLFSNTENLDGVYRGNNNTGYVGDYAFLVNEHTEDLYKKRKAKEWLMLSEIWNLQQQIESIKTWNKRATPQQIDREIERREKVLIALMESLGDEYIKYLEYLEPVMSVRDKKKMTENKLAIRGEVNNLGQEVPRRLPEIFSDRPDLAFDHTSGRLQLANWIAHKTNPLTYRVYVNRIWRHLIGKGIIDSFDNFGILGGEPSNIKLLNYLSDKFTVNRLSTKRLIKTIVMSDVYKRSSNYDDHNFDIDPDNIFFWRANERRLEAEQIRDTLLFVFGKLTGSEANTSDLQTDIKRVSKDLNKHIQTHTGRSIYLPSLRDRKEEVLDIFDRPDNSLMAAERSTTTVSTQALYLMNNPVIINMCKAEAEKTKDIRQLYNKFLSREPLDAELSKINKFISDGGTIAQLIQTIICTGEFRNVK